MVGSERNGAPATGGRTGAAAEVGTESAGGLGWEEPEVEAGACFGSLLGVLGVEEELGGLESPDFLSGLEPDSQRDFR